MKIQYKNILFILVLLNASLVMGQPDPDDFGVLGGDQKTTSGTIALSGIAIVDVEPDPGLGLSFGVSAASLEAGMPAGGGSGDGTNEDLWINFTYRSNGFTNARIYVKTNLPLPSGLTLKVQIISNSDPTNQYPLNPNLSELTLSEAEQVIVYDFGSGYTGDGVNNGYQLRYTMENTSGASLPSGFQVLYEIR